MSDSTLVNDANDATDEIANENGESTDAVGQTSDITIENDTYSKLLEQGLSQTVASRLSEIIQMGMHLFFRINMPYKIFRTLDYLSSHNFPCFCKKI